MANSKYLGRGIHNEKFNKSLMTGNLRQMLEVINNDNNLDVQIRNDYLNIYYRGGNIAKVNSEKSIVFDMFYFYENPGDTPKKEIMEDEKITLILKEKKDKLISKFKEKKYKEYFSEARKTMDKWLKKNPKPEREEQHKLSIENQFNKSDYTIIDLEYQVSTLCEFKCEFIPTGKTEAKKPRFDIIAIDKSGKLCVIELKKGSKALVGTSGLKEHWDCYKQSIKRKHEPFVNEMKCILTQKQSFNLIDSQLRIKHPTPEFIFAYSYDDKTTIEDQDRIFSSEYRKIGAEIPVIKLVKGTFKLLTQ